LLRNPVVDTEIHLTKFIANKGVQIPYISSAAYQCILNGLNQAECMIIQPVMKVEITTTKAYSPKVYSDLSRRNASNMKVTDSNMTDINISARVPLAKLAAYSSDLRRLTSGNTTFTIQFDSYEQLSQREYQELLEKKKF
jgi:elongation factor G